MENKNITDILEAQKDYFSSGATLSPEFRKEKLKLLHSKVKEYGNEIETALTLDLGKSDFEGFMCEVGLVLSEITYMIKHLNKFSGNKRVRTPIAQFPSKSYKKPVPYGNVLIMSPWNYPFLLTLSPLCNAIAAGNTAIVKPSAYSPNTSKIVEKIISECFDPKYIAVITGGRKENAELLEMKFDMIFFTGSQTVGKEVLSKASKHLTPCVLELGGKSPCIVDESAKIKPAAKRIVFGKFLNCGQTCVAPDYILCHKAVKDELVKEIKVQITEQFGNEPLKNPDYGKIINEKHFSRITGLINKEKVVHGGNYDENTLKIEPTVMDNVDFEDAVMGEEIFGPILPIITFENFEDISALLKNTQKPLALYLFTQNKKRIKVVTEEIPYGGGCINDVVIHLATSEMGFGGVGESGMGSYHGKDGFDAFSHYKSIVDKKTWLDLPMRYQPYKKDIYGKLLRTILK